MGGGSEIVGDIWAGGTSSLLLRLLLGWVPLALIKQIPGVSGSGGGEERLPKQSTDCGGPRGELEGV